MMIPAKNSSKQSIDLPFDLYSYQSLCEAIDSMVDMSSHLCQTMGLPIREWVDPADPGGKVPSEPEETRVGSHSQSPGKK